MISNGCGRENIVAAEKIEQVRRGASLLQVVELLGEPVKSFQRSALGTGADVVLLYRGANEYHAIWFLSVAGHTVVERKERFIPDRAKIIKSLTEEGFTPYRVSVEPGGVKLEPE
jgi:hypothetical protein